MSQPTYQKDRMGIIDVEPFYNERGEKIGGFITLNKKIKLYLNSEALLDLGFAIREYVGG